jgi:hypothetical protein
MKPLLADLSTTPYYMTSHGSFSLLVVVPGNNNPIMVDAERILAYPINNLPDGNPDFSYVAVARIWLDEWAVGELAQYNLSAAVLENDVFMVPGGRLLCRFVGVPFTVQAPDSFAPVSPMQQQACSTSKPA